MSGIEGVSTTCEHLLDKMYEVIVTKCQNCACTYMFSL